MIRLFLSFFISLVLVAPLAAFAQDADYVLIGAGVRSRPAYDGSASQVTDLIPMLRYYGSPWFARTTQGMLEGGARLALNSEIHLGAQLAYESGRQRSESSFLASHDMPNISAGVSYGIHAEWDKKIGPMPINLLARVRRLVEADRGMQYDLRFTAGIYGNEKFSAGVFVQETWADAQSTQSLYGVTAQQATAGGLSAFNAGSGPLFASGGFIWAYELSRSWVLSGGLEARHLIGDAARSPIAEKTANTYASASLAYRF